MLQSPGEKQLAGFRLEMRVNMSSRSGNGRPPLVTAYRWVSQITTVSLEMVLPAVLGDWLDKRWGTAPWLVVVGAMLGFATGMRHLLQMVKGSSQTDRPVKGSSKKS